MPIACRGYWPHPIDHGAVLVPPLQFQLDGSQFSAWGVACAVDGMDVSLLACVHILTCLVWFGPQHDPQIVLIFILLILS